ncbi:MAG TPA: hypothetical protein VHC44_06855 [Verrucomicrobiae bacterium]|nr:hypothetical protein [Verrucomicrobiae bacterium]
MKFPFQKSALSKVEKRIMAAIADSRWGQRDHMLTQDVLEDGGRLIAVSRRHNGTIENAIELFIAVGQWPDLSPTQELLLCIRLNFALETVKKLHAQRVKLLRREDETLRWLLVDAWNENESIVVPALGKYFLQKTKEAKR